MSTLQFQKAFDEVSKCCVMWKIENFSSLPKDADFSVNSPSFPCADAIWCLRMHPNVKQNVGASFVHYIDMSIVRLESYFSQHFITFDMQVKEHVGFADYTFPLDGNVRIGDDNTCVVLASSWIEYSDLVKIPNLYLSDGTLTLLFSFKITTRKEKIEVSSQSHQLKCSSKLSEDLKKLMLSPTDSDITIRVKGQEFPAHKAIIGARSPIFDAMLKNDAKVKKSGIIDIEDIDPDNFLHFLSFLYTGCLNKLSVKNTFVLYVAADKYHMNDLKYKCVKLLKNSFSVDNFCDIVAFCFLHKEMELLTVAVSFFTRHAMAIFKTDKWKTYFSENPMEGTELFTKAWQKKFSVHYE